mgnify:CR=1 FL=1|tara:strand:- start:327 stop:998 length:672 start_codon:yes stop_codon:yes gene_type:complete
MLIITCFIQFFADSNTHFYIMALKKMFLWMVAAAIILVLSWAIHPYKATAQTINTLGENTLNGALTGTLLGGASMALTNDTDFYPLQIGLGLGTLYGLGVGAYDLLQTGGNPIVISGIFNNGRNSTIIVLLDTFYGAAAGAVVATSVMLVANEPLVQGLQYGAGAGAIAGFGFGLFDTFVLADRLTTLTFMQPGTYKIPIQSEGNWQLEQQSVIDFVRLSISF